MVEFVVGTGGRSLYEFDEILPTSAAHDNSSYGVLKLTLRPGLRLGVRPDLGHRIRRLGHRQLSLTRVRVEPAL